MRSFFAQLSKGLITERTAGNEKEVGIEAGGEGGGGIFALAKAFLNADIRYAKNSTETKSLHDQIVAEFLDLLIKQKRLQNVPSKGFEWKREKFTDGMFVLASGVFTVTDYQSVVTRIQSLQEIMNIFQNLSNQQTDQQPIEKQSVSHKRNNRGKPQNKDASNLQNTQPTQLQSVSEMINQTLGDLVRVKIYPDTHSNDNMFTCAATREFFRVSPSVIDSAYGSNVKAEWHCLLQINIGEEQPTLTMPVVQSNVFTQALPGQQQQTFEDIVEQLVNVMGFVTSVIQGIRFPAVSATPIIIYREV